MPVPVITGVPKVAVVPPLLPTTIVKVLASPTVISDIPEKVTVEPETTPATPPKLADVIDTEAAVSLTLIVPKLATKEPPPRTEAKEDTKATVHKMKNVFLLILLNLSYHPRAN